jgi:hypothetical protein
MSQCHDTYEFTDQIETYTAHIDLRQGGTAVHAIAAMTFDGQAVVGEGQASCHAGRDGIATRSAAARALVALGNALTDQYPSDLISR